MVAQILSNPRGHEPLHRPASERATVAEGPGLRTSKHVAGSADRRGRGLRVEAVTVEGEAGSYVERARCRLATNAYGQSSTDDPIALRHALDSVWTRAFVKGHPWPRLVGEPEGARW